MYDVYLQRIRHCQLLEVMERRLIIITNRSTAKCNWIRGPTINHAVTHWTVRSFIADCPFRVTDEIYIGYDRQTAALLLFNVASRLFLIYIRKYRVPIKTDFYGEAIKIFDLWDAKNDLSSIGSIRRKWVLRKHS